MTTIPMFGYPPFQAVDVTPMPVHIFQVPVEAAFNVLSRQVFGPAFAGQESVQIDSSDARFYIDCWCDAVTPASQYPLERRVQMESFLCHTYAFLDSMLCIIPKHMSSDYAKRLSAKWNKLCHSINGNQPANVFLPEVDVPRVYGPAVIKKKTLLESFRADVEQECLFYSVSAENEAAQDLRQALSDFADSCVFVYNTDDLPTRAMVTDLWNNLCHIMIAMDLEQHLPEFRLRFEKSVPAEEHVCALSDEVDGTIRSVMASLDILLRISAKAGGTEQGFSLYLQTMRNKLAHCINGNIEGPKTSRKVKKELSEDKKKITQLSKEMHRGTKGSQARKVSKVATKVQQAIPRGLSQDLEMVLNYLAVPNAGRPVRWSSEFSSSPTALAAPWAKLEADWGTTASASSQELAAEDLFLASFRHPLRSTIVYSANPDSLPYAYRAYMLDDSTDAFAPTVPTTSHTVTCVVGVPQFLNISYWASELAYSPHGATMYCGSVRGAPGAFVWLEASSQFVFEGGIIGGTAPVLVIARWDYAHGVDPNYLTATMTAGTQVVDIGASGYYAISFESPVTAGTYSFTKLFLRPDGLGFYSVFGHRALPGFDLNIGATEGIRTISVAAMYTNKAAPLYRQGEIVGYQAPQGSHWTQFVGKASSYSALSNAQGAVTKPLETGMYIFLKPTQPEDFDLISAEDSRQGWYYPLDDESSFTVLYANCSTAEGRQGYWTLGFGVEYMTTDVWRAIAQSRISPEDWRAALIALRDMENIYENPLHLKDIANFVKKFSSKTVKFVNKYGPIVAKAASLAAAAL